MKTVGERIRQAREALGMSGSELARRVGYNHQSAIGNLENRAGATGGNRIALISDALGVPLEWLVRGPDTEEIPFLKNNQVQSTQSPAPSCDIDPIIGEAISLLNKTNKKGRELAIDYLRFIAGQHPAKEHSSGGERDSIPHQKAA